MGEREGGPVEPVAFQNPWELEQFLALVRGFAPERILEVGAMYGGTLWHWLYIGKRVVVVDDEMRAADEWREWADKARGDLHLLQGDSRDPDIVAQAAALGPYDLVFIDADHTYEAVAADFANYPGTVVALHDILPRPAYGVSRVWDEIKSRPGARWVEVCDNVTLPGNEGPCGIGVTWT